MGKDTKSIGILGEISVTKDLMGRGYGVAFPYGDNAPFDLIAFKDLQLLRIQVKSRKSRKGKIELDFRVVSNGKPSFRYSETSIDILAIYDSETDRVGYIPAKLVANRSTMVIELDNYQRIGD